MDVNAMDTMDNFRDYIHSMYTGKSMWYNLLWLEFQQLFITAYLRDASIAFYGYFANFSFPEA